MHTNCRFILLGDEILVVLREAKVEVGGGVGRAAEHVFSITHAALRELVLPTEGCRVLELTDAALILW